MITLAKAQVSPIVTGGNFPDVLFSPCTLMLDMEVVIVLLLVHSISRILNPLDSE